MAEPLTLTPEELQVKIDEAVATVTAGLKTNRDEALKEAKAAKARLAAFDGVDPEEHRKLKQASEEAERKRAAAEGDFKALETQLKDLHTKELGAKDARIGKLTKAMERRLVQAELIKAIVAKKGDPDLLLPHAERFVKVRETEEDFEAFVADEKGNPRYADGQGKPMDFETMVEQVLKPKYPRAFDGTGSSGGGAATSAAGGGGVSTIAAGDNAAFLANLDGIAKGTVSVAS